MIPYILAAVGGYLIGDSLKGKQFAENYSDGGRISKGVKWKQEWKDTKGVEGYDVLEIEDTKYFSNNYGGGIVVRSRIIESSKPERVGNYQEDSKTELRKIFSGKYPFAYKYSEGGKIEVGDKVKYKNAKYHATVIEVIDDAEIPYAKIEYSDGKMKKAYLEDLQKVILGIAPEYVNPEYKSGMMAKGGMVVTSIKDIPNFKQRLKEGKITYRGLGMGKLAKDFYDLAGTNGTRIKVDGKEYFITVEEFDTFSRDANGKMRIRFDAPYRKFEEGGMMANGGRIKVGTFSEEQLKNKEDKKAVEKAQKESGLTYVDTKIIKKGGKMYLDVYLIPNEEYYNSSKFAKGGGVESYSELRKVPKKVAGELTLSPNRTAKLTANKLMLIDNNIWEELDINSGSELYNDDELQKKYVEKLEKANVDKIISSENLIRSKVMDLLEENNYSSLHQYFIYKGVFGEAKRNDYIDMYNSGGSYMFLNPALLTSDLHGKPFPKPKMAKGGQVYKLGDKWSPNFDYTGMLETALKADVSWGIDKLKKLYDSLEDVNYHTASRSLWEALKSLKANDIKAAEKNLENFRSDVMEELK